MILSDAIPYQNMTEQLRIALLTGSLAPSGAEKQFVYAARTLMEHNVEVRVYSLTQSEYYEQVLKDMGLPVVWVGESSSRLKRIIRIIQEMWAFKPHIIQTGQLFTGFYAGIAGRLLGITSIGNMRNSQAVMLELLGQRSFQLALRPTPNLIVNSFNAEQEVKTSGTFNPNHLYVLENVIDLTDFDAKKEQAPEPALEFDAPIKAILVARLVPQKRIERFLNALALAREQVPELGGLIVGDGAEKDNLQQQADELGLKPDGLQFLGLRQDVPALMRQSDIFVLCSDHEGFPNVVIEAMSANLPVITTPAGDSGVVIQDGITGHLVPFDDVDLMAQRLVELAQSPESRQQFGEAGRQRVEQKYSYDSLSGTLFSIYREIAQKQNNKRLLRLLQEN